MPDTAGLGELWIRASRLAEACAITVNVVAVPPGWRVRVEPHNHPGTTAEGVGEHLVEALAVAVNRAESMGLVRSKV